MLVQLQMKEEENRQLRIQLKIVPTREILLVQLQMKEEENRQLRIQLKAALEAIGRSHSYGTDPNIARIRGHPEVQDLVHT